MNNLLNGKKVKLQLVGLDGNAFAVMGNWKRCAKRQGITAAEQEIVIKEAMNGDYDHLLAVISAHTEEPEE